MAFINGTWTSAGTNFTGKYNFAATKLTDGKVLITGGQTTTYTQGVVLYNPATNSWSNKAGMSVARYNHTSDLVTLNDSTTRVLVVGGRASQYHSSAELYNPSNNTWTATTGGLSTARGNHTSTILADGKVLIVGGEYHGAHRSNVDIYNPLSDNWATGSALLVGRYDHTAGLLNDDSVIVVGGSISSGIDDSTLFYNPSTDSWSNGPDLNNARTGHTLTVLDDGRVLVVGGTLAAGGQTYSAEIWDPMSPSSWTLTDSLTYRRTNHTATLLPDGRVLVTGGTGGASGQSSTAQDTAEIWDPSTGLWDETDDPMLTARRSHTATLLDSGSILISNGLGSSAITANTEYFTLDP